MASMDTGHFNCRDYYVAEDVARSKLTASDLRLSASSPFNKKIEKTQPFPFFKLPLELRQKIYLYLIPHTTRRFTNIMNYVLLQMPSRLSDAGPLTVNKSPIPNANAKILWKRGSTAPLRVSRRMHDEYAALMYGNSVFDLVVNYDTTTFRHSSLLRTGLAPPKQSDFLELVPAKYLRLLKQVAIAVDHPDSYTGMIKHNVGGTGLTHGVRKQVQRLVDALLQSADGGETARLNYVRLELVNGRQSMEQGSRSRIADAHGEDEVQTVLEPLMELKGVSHLDIHGSLSEDFAKKLRRSMTVEGSDEAGPIGVTECQ